MNSRTNFLIPIFFIMYFLFIGRGRPLLMVTFLLFPFLIKQRFGIKLWFMEALRFIFNHLHPTLANVVVNDCHLSFQFGLVPRKKYFVQLVQLQEGSQLLVDVRFWSLMWALWGILLLCVVMERSRGPATAQVMGTFP